MPFSKHQKIFALMFLISFAAMMIWAYRSDAKINKVYYKNVWVVLVCFLAILGVLVALIKMTH